MLTLQATWSARAAAAARMLTAVGVMYSGGLTATVSLEHWSSTRG